MSPIDRRRLLQRSAAAATLAGAAGPAYAQAPKLPEQQGQAQQLPFAAGPAAGTAKPPEVTRILANYAASATQEQIPDAVRKEATRTLLNWVGCAIGGSRQDAPAKALAALAPFSGPAQASLLGRPRAARRNEGGARQRDQLARPRLRRHAPAHDHPPGRAGRLRAARLRRAQADLGGRLHDRAGARHRSRVPDGQRGVSRTLRDGLAHHGIDGGVRRGGGDRPGARAGRQAHDLGSRPGRLAAGRP